MNRSYAWLVVRAFCELIRYDLTNSIFGFERVLRRMTAARVKDCPVLPGTVALVSNAVTLATCFYWKPVLCLQRSTAAASMLRKNGVPALLVIGYRSAPFFSHAWVEVDGRVVNDSQGYKERLQILCAV